MSNFRVGVGRVYSTSLTTMYEKLILFKKG